MRDLNKENQEIFLILKILLKDSGQKGFLYSREGRSASLFIMDVLNSLDFDKRVIFVSPKNKNIYEQILQKLGKDVKDPTVEQFLIEFHELKKRSNKRIFIVVEDADLMDQTEIMNLLRIFGNDKDISVIFTGGDKLEKTVEELKPKKIFSTVNFVFRLKSRRFPVLRSFIVLLIVMLLATVFILMNNISDRSEEEKVEIVKKDKEIIEKIQEKKISNLESDIKMEKKEKMISSAVEKNYKKEDDICDFLCLFDKNVYRSIIDESIPELVHREPTESEKYRIYAGAFKRMKNAEQLADSILKKTGLKPEIEDLGRIKNVYLKAYTREEAIEIRDKLNEIGIKPFIKRLEK
ncbi:AAA family ATPase [Persephonella sp.]